MLAHFSLDGQLVFVTEDGTQIFSANEIGRLLCGEAGQREFAGGDPLREALVDYWLEWEARELKVGRRDIATGPEMKLVLGSIYPGAKFNFAPILKKFAQI